MDYTGLPGSAVKTGSSTKRRSSSADKKRQLIIESAERIFAARGFHDTAIADISHDSGVHEASIFQYFKTKENLIVTVPERHLRETLAGITEHLQGMKGAEPKIRKLLWHQLRDLSVNKSYTSILLSELRTLPAFYQSPAYEMIREYSAFAVEAIREGIRDREVDPDVEVILVLEMIFGAIDSIVLRWLFFGDPYDPNEAADALCSLVKAAIWRREQPTGSENGDEPTRGELRRRSIVEVASEVFGKKGYGGATISEIAGKAGIAEASIYQYFKSKEQLLLSVLGTWFIELADELERVFSGALNPYEQLLYLLRRWALDFQIRESETRVLILELYRNPKFYESQEYQNTRRFTKLIRSIVEAGRQSGHFRKDFEISYYLHLVQGAFEHEALARMMLSKKQPTIASTEQMINLLLRAIKA
ncbi:MAG: TetR/AcrR family transcriptional regulator [Deltaproteobacteria bacterium]|nr:TetR/AcrR family transcriptional regulator [Deltaproteobacteria bacterium]